MKKVLYVAGTLPGLTVTFIYREIFRLRSLGFSIETVSMNTPGDDEIDDETNELRKSTVYLDQQSLPRKLLLFLVQGIRHPVRFLTCMRVFVTASPMKSVRDYARLAYHLLEGGYLALRYRKAGIDHLHSHLINGPTSIAMFASIFLDIPFSFTMHASMIWLDPIAFRNKLELCKFCVSISDYNKRYVLRQYGERFAPKIHIVHCGIDPERTLPAAENGKSDQLSILGVGQLTARKGFPVLIAACRLLSDKGVAYHCTIVGEGSQRRELEQAIADNSLGRQVTLAGAVPQRGVMKYLMSSDVFVLPCVISKDGWRDGIPVALMEAMFARLPVVSTDILGLPELIEHGVSGLLVAPEDSAQLAEAIASVCDARIRQELGSQAREKVLKEFNNDLSARSLASLLSAP